MRAWAFGRYREDVPGPVKPPDECHSDDKLRGLVETVLPAPKSKAPRYADPEDRRRLNSGRPLLGDRKLTKREKDQRYRTWQKLIPCADCGRPSWCGGVCKRDYYKRLEAKRTTQGGE